MINELAIKILFPSLVTLPNILKKVENPQRLELRVGLRRCWGEESWNDTFMRCTVVGFFSFFSPFTVFYNLYNFFFSERSGCSSEEHLEEAVRENYNFVKRAFNRS